MASRWFDGLSEKQQGFLIATLLFKSKEKENSFKYLAHEDAEKMLQLSDSISRLERTQRVQLLVAQLRLLLASSSNSWLSAVDPSWLVELLGKEISEIQILVLSSMPKTMLKPISKGLSLSKEHIQHLPKPSLFLSAALRKAIEKQLTPMRSVSFEPNFSPSQLLVLTRNELEVLLSEAEKRGGFKGLDPISSMAQLMRNETKNLQLEIAQRLHIKKGKALLQAISSETRSLEDVSALWKALLVDLANERKVDERFAIYAEPQ